MEDLDTFEKTNVSSKAVSKGKERETGVRKNKHKAHKAQVKERDPSSSDSEASESCASCRINEK